MNDIQLEALNEMIDWCITNGGDAGGPYDSYPDECKQSIQRFLIVMGESHLCVTENNDNWNRPIVVKTEGKQPSEIW